MSTYLTRASLVAAARRRWLPFVAAVLYVSVGSLMSTGGVGPLVWLLSVTSWGLAVYAARRTQRVLGYAWWGVALVVASLAAPAGAVRANGSQLHVEGAGAVGALSVLLAALHALSRTEAAPSVLSRPVTPPGPLARGVLLGSTFGAVVVHAGEASASWAAFFGLLSMSVVLVTCVSLASSRRLELGIIDRLRAAGAATAISLALAATAALTGVTTADRAVRAAAAASGLLITLAALHEDAVKIALASRAAVGLAALGGPLVLIGALLAEDRPRQVGMVVAVVGVLALLVGSSASALAGSLRPAHGAWLDALARAHQVLDKTDPDDAFARLLITLREPVGTMGEPPELWLVDPPRMLQIDVAGYVREREAALPAGLAELALREPEGVLRVEVLEACEVRRPDLRPHLKWLDERRALMAVAIHRGEEIEGLLVVPRGLRFEPLSLEEARAARSLADHLGAVCHARSALARGLARERALEARAEEADLRSARLEHDASQHEARHALAARRLARPATVGIYGAAARMAYEALERRAVASAPLVVLAASGVDPVPYIARAHLAGPRGHAPLVLVDGTASRDHDVTRWTDRATSPLALAEGGTLLLVDGAALPMDVQRLIGLAVAERRAPWESSTPLDVVLGLTAVEGGQPLLERLDMALAARLMDAIDTAVHLPRLRDRPEDLRAVLTDRLAREGLRVLGEPVGLDDGAYARLVEHAFPGEDVEMAALVERLVARCAQAPGTPPRRVIHAEDVEAVGLLGGEALDGERGDPTGRPHVRLV